MRPGYAASGNAYRQKPKTGTRQPGQPLAVRVQERVLQAFGFTRVKLPTGPRPTYSEAYEGVRGLHCDDHEAHGGPAGR